MKFKFFIGTLVGLLPIFVLAATDVNSQDPLKLAKIVPIADVHRHVNKFVSPAALAEQMNANNIGWSGAVGPYEWQTDRDPYLELLGDAYIPTAGQSELTQIFFKIGPSAIEDENNRFYQELFSNADELFANKKIKGFGELILNNKTSNPVASFRRKVTIDSPPIERMMSIANKNGGFVQIHSEDDEDSIAQIKHLANLHPKTPIILSHCLMTPNTKLVSDLLKANANIYCDLSARTPLHFLNPDSEIAKSRIVYSESFADPNWIALIEAYPTRFMVGSDTFKYDIDFEKVISAIRNGLLSRLKTGTIELVAYKNAQKVMNLK
ncbi:amidohydrolase family protein [Polynucleobacter sp. TSB-Sco08W16]|uniref:amidohydrolase family protein n=1 Tax=Polynucleobacter sp. TSB-Sco08W16 TaxID=1758374 RepID=UPI001BFE1688|nr:amidohydrolase family protein [Polynucleobacter sp. TSB-Sco08W16]QWD74259.1 amidohydrolase family protein [Polynucleobacter sp. TSB-Sco08W16]